MNYLKAMSHSLAFKVGSAIVLAEALVLILTGILYVSRFSSEIDRGFSRQVQLPGDLMQAGLLNLDAIADAKTMREIIGEDLITGVVVDTTHRVVYSLDPVLLGMEISDIAGMNVALFRPGIPTSGFFTNDNKYVGITPLFETDNHTLRDYVYVEASTVSIQNQKIGLIQLFLLASAATTVFTWIVLYWMFKATIFSKLHAMLLVLNQVEGGDLGARVIGTIATDEIGALQKGVNSMIVRLEEQVETLEQRVQDRTQELIVARQVAEAASHTKSLFLSNMSHELRTPLNMVIGYSSAMLMLPQMYNHQPLPPIFQKDIRLIQESGEYLLGLINDVLDLSKIEAEKLTLDFQCVDLTGLFQGVIATSLGLVKDKPLQIMPDYPEQLPIVWADPVRIRQILLNLLSNAVKFTNSGTIMLSARIEENRVAIAVSDTGIGIPETSLRAIFDRYEQVRTSAETSFAGTGLGLDISQRLCQMHHTQLTVRSKLGQGSTFAFELVCATPEQLATREDQVSVPVLGGSVKLLGQADLNSEEIRQILVAENHSGTRALIREALENAGYVVVETSDGNQVSDLVLGLLPDAMICSVPLSGVDIWDVFDTVRTHPETANTPIIVLGDLAGNPFDERRAEAAGFKFLTKPLSPHVLVGCLRQLFAEAIAS